MMREKIVVIGAGSAVFTRGLISDLIHRGWDADLALVDIDSKALAVAEGLARKMIDAKKAPIQLEANTDRRKVLADATAVICVIGVGGRRAWEQDVLIPRKYGIYQPVGDSVMPGGASRALRMVPAMVDIANDVLDLAPEALFFSYANPMSAICRAVRKATGAKLTGLCHGVFHVAEYLADILGEDPADTNYTAIGMNHLTWFTEYRVKGEDAMHRLLRIAAGKLANGPVADIENLGASFAEGGTLDNSKTLEQDQNPFSWQLLKLFGAFPAVLDRHVTEFFPQMHSSKNAYYTKTLGVDAYSFEDTITQGDKKFKEMENDAFSPDPLGEEYFDRISGEHEQVLEIIDSIRTDAGRIYSANLPNTGQVANLPMDAVIESPAVVDGAGIRAISQTPLSPGIAGTLATRLQWVETVVDAALEGSRDKFVQALILDGSVQSVEMAEKLADELLEAHKEHLPQFDQP